MRAQLAALASVVLLAGCGGGGSGDAPAATPAPAATVEVSAPENGASVKAKREIDGRLWAKVPVRGTTDPGVRLVISATCRSEVDCLDSTSAGPDGAFATEIEVWSDPGGKQGHLEVGAEGSAPIDRPRLTVLLVAAERKAPKPAKVDKEKRKRKPRSREREVDPLPPAPVPEDEAPAAPEQEPATPVVPAPPETAGGSGRTVVMIGDSLAVGTEPYLSGLLSGDSVTTSARIGRPLAEGMNILGRTTIPAGKVALAFSLFTNDNPGSVAALDAAVRNSVDRAGRDGCAIWATIARPPFKGVSYQAANQRLRTLEAQLGGKLIVVPWAETVASSPSLLGKDRVHATSAGYRLRAQLYADAIRSCRR